jgi:hypothetical protein
LRKHLVLVALLALSLPGTAIFAQQTTAPAPTSSQAELDKDIQLLRQDLRSGTKQIVAANLPLTDAEATKFWPVYDRFTAATAKQNDTKVSLIKEYAANNSSLTDAQASSLMKRSLEAQAASTQLRIQWIPEFEKVISPKKTAMFMQIDHRIGLIIDLQLASELPLVQP